MTTVWRARFPTWSNGNSGAATWSHRWFPAKADAEAWLRERIRSGLLDAEGAWGPKKIEKQEFPNDEVSLAQLLNRRPTA